MLLTVGWILLGFVGLTFGSDIAVRAARVIAKALGVPTLVVGLTVASVGTSIPEIATNVAVGFDTLSGAADASGIAVGNIVGSCMSQVTILLGLTGLARGLPFQSMRRDGGMLVLAMVLMTAASADGTVWRWEAAALILAYAVYLAVVYRSTQSEPPPQDTADASMDHPPMWPRVLQGLVGLAVVAYSASVVVDQGVALARAYSMPETLIGVYIGVGTGLPELALALGALFRNDEGMAIGNLLGSNITDPLLSFGAGALVHPVTVSMAALRLDYVFWFFATTVALLLLRTGKRLDRQESIVLSLTFVLYLIVRWETA
ncbi:MAG: sodium:calcium antiporter [Proteobacteria bacterium]|nr:sodium:calcium antiporter [Pseudomonadota bacterium]